MIVSSERVQLEQATGTVEAIRGDAVEVLWDTGARCPVPIRWLSDAPGCEECGGEMDAERSTRKFCSDSCRVRAFRRNAKGGGRRGQGETRNGRDVLAPDVRQAA